MTPFGFDPIEAEKAAKEIRNVVSREYVEVVVKWQLDGVMKPIYFIWGNGKEYQIDRILAVRKGNSLKAFAPGFRYYCQTGRRRYYLLYDGESWFIETKK
jgi:hypothetical protein